MNQVQLEMKIENNSNAYEYYMTLRKGHRRKKRFKGDSRPSAWRGTLWYTSTSVNPAATRKVNIYTTWWVHFTRIIVFVPHYYSTRYGKYTTIDVPYTAYYYDEDFLIYYTELLKKRSEMEYIFDKAYNGPFYDTHRPYICETTVWAYSLLKFSAGSLKEKFKYKRVSNNII